MRKSILFSILGGSVLAASVFSPLALSADDDNHSSYNTRHELYNNRHELAKFIGITSKSFWENDGEREDYTSRACSRRNNKTPAKLLNCVKLKGVLKHLRSMQDIADANGGNRVAGAAGYDASADYVRDQLLAAGYQVRLQEFSFQTYRPEGPSTLAQTAPGSVTYVEDTDYTLMSQTDSGDVSGPVTAVNLDLGPGNFSASGCDPADFIGFPLGHIALIQRGACSFRLKAENAAAAGAVGAIIFNQGNNPGRLGLINGTLSAGYTGGIPVFFATYANGEAWSATAGLNLHMVADVFRGTAITNNIIAETATGNPNNVVMLGAHLDSVNDGPGINDNGSGSAAILEVALQMKKHKPNNKLRFAWWSAEESGLIGSTYYVDQLTGSERANLAVYMNFDMVGSPNFMRGIYDGDGSDFGLAGPAGSAAVETLFELFYSIQGLASEGSEISFRSDYAQFFRTGIPFGGLFTGAESIKTPAQQALYGGTAGEQLDPCYHATCDNIDNLDHGVLSLNADAVALSALLFSYTTAPIDAQQVPVAARAFSASSNNVSKFDHIETWGKHYIK